MDKKKRKWHVVKWSDGLPSSDQIEEIERWITEQWQADSMGIWLHEYIGTFKFRNGEDAVAFKLRWI